VVQLHGIQRRILSRRSFLRNHAVWVCDFLQTYDVWFRPIFAFFVVDINTPFGEGPQFIIRDNDNKFGTEFDRVAKGAGMNVLRTAIRAPLQNCVCERFLGSVRRECLDHVIILGRRHLKEVLEEYSLRYFNTGHPHQGIGQRVPVPIPAQIYRKGDKINSGPILGGAPSRLSSGRMIARIGKGASTGSSNNSGCTISIPVDLTKELFSKSLFQVDVRSTVKASRSSRCPFLVGYIMIISWPRDDADLQGSQDS
jgi:hypothetical protein